MNSRIREDIENVRKHDPAAGSTWEVLSYAGLHAIWIHRAAHRVWHQQFPSKGFCKVLARWISQFGRFWTGVEIHPGAIIGRRFFVDHGMGIVIGETAEIGDDVVMYHQVTLGGTSLAKIKRHPTIGNHVLIGMGAKVVGAIKVGDGCRIGANAVVNKDIPANCTVVGVPGRIVVRDGYRVENDMPVMDDYMNRVDPQDEVIREMRQRVELLEQQIEMLENRFSARAGQSSKR